MSFKALQRKQSTVIGLSTISNLTAKYLLTSIKTLLAPIRNFIAKRKDSIGENSEQKSENPGNEKKDSLAEEGFGRV